MYLIRCISPTYTVHAKTEEVNRPSLGQLSCPGVRKMVRDRMFPAHILGLLKTWIWRTFPSLTVIYEPLNEMERTLSILQFPQIHSL